MLEQTKILVLSRVDSRVKVRLRVLRLWLIFEYFGYTLRIKTNMFRRKIGHLTKCILNKKITMTTFGDSSTNSR